MLWDKLSWNASFNAVTALTRMTSGEAARHPETARLLREVMLEVIAVAHGQGILLDTARVDGVIAHAAEHLGTLRTSMLQDVERGGRLEYDAINGAVVRVGEAVGVATPLNRVLVALLSAVDDSRHSSRQGTPPRR
jgi:2-dehydropantoate 2-reductase